MNRFLLMPKPKPEFKMVQPLPAFLGVSTTRRSSDSAPEAVASGLRQGDLPKFLVCGKRESFTTAVRNMTS
jgi:hypothetical protein